jgi:hypothetical protein
MMPKQSRARVSHNKVTNSPAKAPRFFNRLLEGRQEHAEQKKRVELSRRSFLVKALVGALAGGVALGAPSLLRADERVARAEVSKESSIRYETFSDPAELEPYFENARDKLVSIKPGEVKRIGEFDVWIKPCAEDPKNEFGTEFRLRDGNGKEHRTVFGPLSETNILEVDPEDDHPYLKGKAIIIADATRVSIAIRDSRGYLLADMGRVRRGKMREGPIRTGVMLDGATLVIIGSPKQLREGDVVYQAQLDARGNTRGYFYKYSTNQPEGTMVASL